jgi:hypothetical protein
MARGLSPIYTPDEGAFGAPSSYSDVYSPVACSKIERSWSA